MSGGSGVLYLVGTPIGNLEDMTPRAVRVLGEVDVIAAEDTRRTMALCNHFGIRKRVISYHEHNKETSGERIVSMILSGAAVALVSDAGMPGFSDPGCELVDRCHDAGIKVVPVPGPNAAVTALVCSGFRAQGFVFEGFLPRQRRRRLEALERYGRDPRAVVVYESPQRVAATLNDIATALGDRQLVVARELTKLHEEIIRARAGEAASRVGTSPIGEFVIVIEGSRALSALDGAVRRRGLRSGAVEPPGDAAGAGGDGIVVDPARAVRELEKAGVPKMEAIKALAKAAGIPKRELYAMLQRDTGE